MRASTACQLLELDRAAFSRLMGPLVPAMQREAEQYLAAGGTATKWKPKAIKVRFGVQRAV